MFIGKKGIFLLMVSVMLVVVATSCNKYKPGTYYSKIDKKMKCDNGDPSERGAKTSLELEIAGNKKNKFEGSSLKLKTKEEQGGTDSLKSDLEGKIESGKLILKGTKHDIDFKLSLTPSSAGFDGELTVEGQGISCKAKSILLSNKEE